MNEEVLGKVYSEVLSRFGKHSKAESLLSGLFPEQRAFIHDPRKRKAALCSRRAGKSYAVAAYLIQEALDPVESDVGYIGLTRSSAKKIMFRPLMRMNEKYNLGFQFNRAELTATAPNGNIIYLTGAHTEEDSEKFRGAPKGFKLIALDECASFKAHLNYLIEEVLEPTLIDTDGTLAMIGTASANPAASYFYKATVDSGEGFSVHKWTILNNPHIPHAAQWLEEYRSRKGWDLSHPIYRREWLGEWTTDGDTLVYRYRKDRNHYDRLPQQKWTHVLGVDLGSVDAFTICVLAFSEDTRELYVVDQFKKTGLYPEQWAKILREYMEKYQPVKIKADHGGLGKAICESFRVRFHIPVEPAEKSEKRAAIELCNGDLISGLIKIPDSSPLAQEMKMNQWDPNKPGKEDPRTPNDLCDAFLYGYREAKHYLGEVKPLPHEPGSVPYHDDLATKLLEKELEEFEDSQRKPWWETV